MQILDHAPKIQTFKRASLQDYEWLTGTETVELSDFCEPVSRRLQGQNVPFGNPPYNCIVYSAPTLDVKVHTSIGS